MRPDDAALDKVHALMMAALDGECTDADRRQLDAELALNPSLQAEWERLRRVKEVTMTIAVARPPEEVWDRYRSSVLHRTERGVAWFLIAVGAAVLGAVGLWKWIEAWLATDLRWEIKAASAALLIGVALLIVSVLRERWYLHRRDPYSKEVLR
jgi:ferric-dicitrate binding protein FerR (iron transport regulator)